MKEGLEIGRKIRIWYPGAIYHIMIRGIRRTNIFQDEEDRQVMFVLLKKVKKKYPFIVHAFCFMTNHVHFLIESKEEEIWTIMKYFSHSYAMYYNRKYGYRGHLFEDRYKSCLVKDDGYFLQTSRYIHLNPVKAKMVSLAENYKWSSYRTILRMEDDTITECHKTLSYFKDKNPMRYRDFVEDIGRKYYVEEDMIRKEIGEDDLWLPW